MKLYIKFYKENKWKLHKPYKIFENRYYIYLQNKKGDVYKAFERLDIYQIDIQP